jgi:nucleoside-diphosphate-sugar epimerase
MNIIITGSTGFVGRHLIPALNKEGHKILELTRKPYFSEELYGNATQKFDLSTNNQQKLEQAIQLFRPQVVIHLASYLTSADDYENSEKLINTNIVYLNNVLNALRQSGLHLFINTGTFAEYFKGDGNLEPAYLYAATKTASRYIVDYYANAFDFNYATVVPYTIYGGNDSQKKIIDIMYDSFESPQPLDLSPGGQILDFIHINDVVAFYCKMVQQYLNVPNKAVYHLGTGTGNSLKQLAQILSEKAGRTVNINWGGKPYRPTDVMYAVADTALQHTSFNWETEITLEDGVEIYLQNKTDV